MNNSDLFSFKPPDCDNPLVVAGGVLRHEDRCLLLKRHPEKAYGSHWNLPAGKVEKNESPHLGAQREIHEETGIFIPLENLKPVNVFYLKRENDFVEFHVYEALFDQLPEVTLKMDENIEAIWTSHEEALKLPLLSGGGEILKFCLKNS